MKLKYTIVFLLLFSKSVFAQCGIPVFSYAVNGYNATFLDGSIANTGVTIVSYSWEFGDGSSTVTTTSNSVVHTYPAPGFYSARHWFNGSTGCKSDTVTVAVVISAVAPLQLGNFTINNYPKGIQLQWNSIAETNFSHFEIQKSADNVSFKTIGHVYPSSSKNYSFVDGNLHKANNIYRLKMVDKDGSFQFSKTVAVNNANNDFSFSVINPSNQGTITISLENYQEGFIQVQVFDMSGAIKTSVQTASLNGKISLAHNLPVGNYVVKVIQGHQQSTKLLVVQ